MTGRGSDGTIPRRRGRLLLGLVVLGVCAALASPPAALASPSVTHAGISLPPSDPTHNPLLTLHDNDISIGVDLDWGGALSVLFDKKTGRNLINRHDVGRLVQQSYYGAGKYAGCDFGMNPVQGGDSAGNESGVQAATRQGGTVYVRSRPLDWCLNGQHPDVTYENWYTLEGSAVHVVARATFRNVGYGGIRSQEWPAIFTIPELNNYVRYDGDQPFTGGALSSSVPGFPNETQSNTEGWGSHVDSSGRGLGWFVPNVFTSTNYNYTGQGGTGDLADATSYSAPIPSVSLSANSVFQYEYWLVAGTPDDVRNLARTHWAPSQSVWAFDHANDRQMWSASAAVDGDGPTAAGWTLQQRAGQTVTLMSPPSTIPAAQRPIVEVDLQHSTDATELGLSWQTNDGNRTGQATLPLQATGDRHVYRLDLSKVPEWTGDIENLQLSLPAPQAGSVTIHRIAVVPATTTDSSPPAVLRTQTRPLGQGAVDADVWSTTPVTAALEYGQNGSLDKRTPETRQLSMHQTVHLSDLQPGAHYNYRVVVRDAQGREVLGPTRTLTVPTGEQPAAGLVASINPVSQTVPSTGATSRFTVTLDGIAAKTVSGTLTATAPDGWSITPATQPFVLTSNGRQVQRTYTLDVAVPAGVPASQQFPIKVVATAGNGLYATASGNVNVTATGAAWEFNTDGDAEGWAPTHSLAAFDVSGGLLHTSVTGGDPYMVQSQPLAIDATNGVDVQIAVQTTNPGPGQIFFSTPSGGFSETNSVTFPITGSGMNTYQITIPPQDGPLTGLRFDPPDGAGDISVDYIRAASQ